MRRRIFLPMTRITAVDAGQVVTTGLVNMRRFEQRPSRDPGASPSSSTAR